VSVSNLICDADSVATVAKEVTVVSPIESENVISADSLPQDWLEGDGLALVSEPRADRPYLKTLL